jgi:hypothetical protein
MSRMYFSRLCISMLRSFRIDDSPPLFYFYSSWWPTLFLRRNLRSESPPPRSETCCVDRIRQEICSRAPSALVADCKAVQIEGWDSLPRLFTFHNRYGFVIDMESLRAIMRAITGTNALRPSTRMLLGTIHRLPNQWRRFTPCSFVLGRGQDGDPHRLRAFGGS